MPVRGTTYKPELKPLDTLLFGADEDIIQRIRLDRLFPFKDHPFRLYGEEKMKDMVASIAEHGVMTPLVTRPYPNGDFGEFEIISGHNRHEAAQLAGLAEVPIVVRDVDDATAILMMISSNFEQREELLPSEKAFAYKMQLEAISVQGQRNDLQTDTPTSGQVGQKLAGVISRDLLSQTADESSRQIHRFIRLTELIPSLLERVDNKTLPFVAAVDLSYLTEEEQEALDELLTVEGIKSVTNAQAAKLKEESREEGLDELSIVRILHDKAEPILASVKLTKRLQEYIPPDTLPREAENLIIRAMDIRSIALSHLPEGAKEQDLRDVLPQALDLYARMGLGQDSSVGLDRETQDREEDGLEP